MHWGCPVSPSSGERYSHQAVERVRASAADDDELAALVALAGLPNLGPSRFWSLLDLGAPTEVWGRVVTGRVPPSGRADDAAYKWQAWGRRVTPAQVLERHRAEAIHLLPYGAAGFPEAFLDDPDPPVVLFGAGPQQAKSAVAVAIVGTRKCTRYGKDVAHELGALLAGRGVPVISGLAHGIDAGAHAGAMTTDPRQCVAVVAGGLDVVYPKGNRHLWNEVRAHGRIMSEWPLGAAPQRWRFPARNRLVAALASVVVVVESAERGGSMYTVDEALRRDREVFAVPGSVRSPASAGTNRLIADGAQVVASPLAFADALVPMRDLSPRDGAPRVQSWLLELIGWEPIAFEGVVQASGRSVAEVNLEIERLISLGSVRRFGAVIERLS